MLPIKISASPDTPCNAELEAYTVCTKQYPGGLKETDCDDVKAVFRKCMTEWKKANR